MEHRWVTMLICNIWWVVFKAKMSTWELMPYIRNFSLRVRLNVFCKTFNKLIILMDKILIIVIWCIYKGKITMLIHRNFSLIVRHKVILKITFFMLRNINQIVHWLKSKIHLVHHKLIHNHINKVPADQNQATFLIISPNSMFLTNKKWSWHKNKIII